MDEAFGSRFIILKNSMKTHARPIAIYVIVFCMMHGSCKNPFATREAEPPTEGRTSWQFPTDPVIVLENMKVAIREKNVENYMKCLVDSVNLFRFVPDQFEASNHIGIFERWNLTHEQSYINKAFTSIPDDSLRSLRFSSLQRSEFPDSALIRADYVLELNHILKIDFPKLAQGRVDFWFVQRNGYWVIRRWIDFETKLDSTATRIPSWSTLKASFIKS